MQTTPQSRVEKAKAAAIAHLNHSIQHATDTVVDQIKTETMPVLLAVTAGTLAVGGSVAVVKHFSRESPRWPRSSTHDGSLCQSSAVSDIRAVRKLPREERVALQTAFLAAGEQFQWMVSGERKPLGYNNNDEKNDDENFGPSKSSQQQHQRLAFYMVECDLAFAEEYGHVLTARDPKTQEYLGSIGLIPPYSSSSKRNFHFTWTVLQLGVPPSTNKETKARLEAFRRTLEEQHEKNMLRIPHWHVINLGVVPNAQGRGVGTALLQAAFEIAGDLPLYLACQDDKVSFFQKNGFAVSQRFMLEPRGIENATPFPFNAMVRLKQEQYEV